MAPNTYTVDEVFGVSRDLPLNYVVRDRVDEKFIDSLSRNSHIVIYGSSKQGKTSLRKYCLKETDCIVISCQNKWNCAELHSAILKECGYSIKLSTSKTVSGANKIVATVEGKGGLPFIAEAKGGATIEHATTTTATNSSKELELDPNDVNDIIRALNEISLSKYVVLEDFHYLPDDTQRDFSFSLKAFHEKSKLTFVIIGVWREENRLITYNGDLTDRVFAVDVDTWSRENLLDVIKKGQDLLNVKFDDNFISTLLAGCFDSVHLVQEVCRRALRADSVFKTCSETALIAHSQDANKLIAEVVNDQRGRYDGFLMNFSDGFQQTDLEMPKWIIYVVLTSTIDQLRDGLKLREISRKIKSAHPRGEDLNNGNITQALNSASSLQVKKNIRPIIIDYDSVNKSLHVVDKGFLNWLASQNTTELLQNLDLPIQNEPQ